MLTTLPLGNATTPFTYTITSVGPIESVTVGNGGVGYFDGIHCQYPATDLVQPITYPVTAIGLQQLDFASNAVAAGTFTTSQSVTGKDGTPTALTVTTSTQLTANVVGPLATTLTTGGLKVTLSSTTGISAGYIVTAVRNWYFSSRNNHCCFR